MQFPCRSAVLLLSLTLGTVFVGPAAASSDTDCESHLKVERRNFARCDGTAALSPGNDTRINLLLLLLDHDGPEASALPAVLAAEGPLMDWRDVTTHWPAPSGDPGRTPGFAAGEGTRCHSNAAGTRDFAAAIDAARDLPAKERDALLGARQALAPVCVADPKKAEVKPLALEPMQSAMGRGFETYLRGVDAFYGGDYGAASAAFAKLHGNADAWLAETGDYMVARTALNSLQVGAFDEYGTFAGSDHVDKSAADRAVAAFEAYLREHPNGAYAASARGLILRVDWLAGRTEKLAAGYTAMIALPPARRSVDERSLAEEIGDALLPTLTPEMTRDPILLATLDLFRMREAPVVADKSSGGNSAPPPRIDLESQRSAFADALPLFDYLQASEAFYLDHDPAKVLKLLPDDTKRRGGNNLWFSRQVLRGLALDAKQDRNARDFWKQLYAGVTRPLDQQLVQLALALQDERAGSLGDVFASGSIVTNPTFRTTLIERTADAPLLRKIAGDPALSAKEHELAATTLVYKDVTRARYDDVLRDITYAPSFAEQKPGDLDCPDLKETAAQLVKDPQLTRPRLCVSEFMRANNGRSDLDVVKIASDELGGGTPLFSGTPVDRATIYKDIIADTGAPAADRAYALYRAVKCYEPSGNNECGGPDAPKPLRERWYKSLRHDYPGSRWVKALRYWW